MAHYILDGKVYGYAKKGATQMTDEEFKEFKYRCENPEKTAQQRIEQIESKQTQRMLREAALGCAESIAMLQDIESQIAELRDKI